MYIFFLYLIVVIWMHKQDINGCIYFFFGVFLNHHVQFILIHKLTEKKDSLSLEICFVPRRQIFSSSSLNRSWIEFCILFDFVGSVFFFFSYYCNYFYNEDHYLLLYDEKCEKTLNLNPLITIFVCVCVCTII